MRFYWLVIAMLGTWRITHLLQAEDGPWDLVVRLRLRAGEGVWGRVLDCFQCLSLWIAVLPSWLLGDSWLERALLWPALSAGAILLERSTAPARDPHPILYHEDAEVPHGVLRKQETGE